MVSFGVKEIATCKNCNNQYPIKLGFTTCINCGTVLREVDIEIIEKLKNRSRLINRNKQISKKQELRRYLLPFLALMLFASIVNLVSVFMIYPSSYDAGSRLAAGVWLLITGWGYRKIKQISV